MEKQAFIDALQKIGTCEDDVERRNLISDLQDEAIKDYDNIVALTQSNDKLTQDNENLRSANMKLFTRLGKDETEENIDPNNTGIKNDKPEKLSFTDLFNEKGELK